MKRRQEIIDKQGKQQDNGRTSRTMEEEITKMNCRKRFCRETSLIFLIILACSFLISEVVPAQPQSASVSKSDFPEAVLQLLKENRFLEEELKLARKPQYYFVLNLKEKTLELRARGMVLKSWKAAELRYTGKPVPLQVTRLTGKTALKLPERKVINPEEKQTEEARRTGEKAREEENKKNEKKKQTGQAGVSASAAADSFEVEAMEITDMPGSYELNFDSGLRIYVRSKSDFRESFRQTRERLLWYTWYPVKYLINRNSELRPQLILYFDNQRQAQGIYWAFIDGIKGIIWFP